MISGPAFSSPQEYAVSGMCCYRGNQAHVLASAVQSLSGVVFIFAAHCGLISALALLVPKASAELQLADAESLDPCPAVPQLGADRAWSSKRYPGRLNPALDPDTLSKWPELDEVWNKVRN